jgi:hypothetical protein
MDGNIPGITVMPKATFGDQRHGSLRQASVSGVKSKHTGNAIMAYGVVSLGDSP